jgi:hypothetical protein
MYETHPHNPTHRHRRASPVLGLRIGDGSDHHITLCMSAHNHDQRTCVIVRHPGDMLFRVIRDDGEQVGAYFRLSMALQRATLRGYDVVSTASRPGRTILDKYEGRL